MNSIDIVAEKSLKNRAWHLLGKANHFLQLFDYDAPDYRSQQIDHLERRLKELESTALRSR